MTRISLPLTLALGGLLLLGTAAPVLAEEAPAPTAPTSATRVMVIDFPEAIEAVLAAYVIRHLERAEAEGVELVILRIESPGGTVHHSIEIADHIFGMPDTIRTVAWVPRQALSGACMVAMACHEIVMGANGILGDCQPIVMDPESGGIKPVGEKVESPLRALFRKYARRAGHPVALAEAFVSEHLEVLRVRDTTRDETHFVAGGWFRDADPDALLPTQDGPDGEGRTEVRRRDLVQVGAPVVTEGQLLTVDATEALEMGFMDRRFPSRFPADEDAVLAAVAPAGAVVERVSLSFSERWGRILLGLSGILGALVMLSLVLFLFQGPGVFTLVGLGALVILLMANATADQVHAFPLFLVLLGAGLLVVEVLFLPGTGVAGILGFALVGVGFLLLATGSSLENAGERISKDTLVSFGLQFVLTSLAGMLAILFLARVFPNLGPGRRLRLATPTPSGGNLAIPTPPALPRTGETGEALSPLRPAGSARFGDLHVDVTSDGRYVEPGTAIRVVAVEGGRVTVEPVGRPGTPS